MPDRSKQPELKIIDKFNVLNPEIISLSNGIPLNVINTGDQDVLKIRLIFSAGTWFQPKKLVAHFTARMLTEGSLHYNAEQIATMLDNYGAFMDASSDSDNVHVNIYLLNKYAHKVLPLLAEVVRNPVFPVEELEPIIANEKQSLAVSMKKTDYLARIYFKEMLYGKTHPYGMWANPEDYDKLRREDLVTYYSKYYNNGQCRIVVAGKIQDAIIALIEKYFGNWNLIQESSSGHFSVSASDKKTLLIPVEKALQTSVQIGRILFRRNHPDFFGMACLNTILGGYFGSRLMKNIREDKGYTYGIGSNIVLYKNSGFLSIHSDVKAEARVKVTEEIYKEINILRNQLVQEEELRTVKNYMLGALLRSIDGPFAQEDRFVSVMDCGIKFDEYMNNYIHEINTITPERILQLAQEYLIEESFVEVYAGK